MLLIVVASRAEHRLERTGLVVVANRLSCSVSCGISLDQGSNPSPALAGRFFTTEPAGQPQDVVLVNGYFLLSVWKMCSLFKESTETYLLILCGYIVICRNADLGLMCLYVALWQHGNTSLLPAKWLHSVPGPQYFEMMSVDTAD